MTSHTQSELLSFAKDSLLGNYRQPPFVFSRAEGVRMYDTEGRSYLDFCAGIAVCCLGHSHPKLSARISEQAGKLMHLSNLFYNEQNILLAHEIRTRTGFDKIFFCNSGTEANEALIKLGRRWHYEHGDKKRTKMISTINGFHGRTMGALSATGQEKYHAGFEPLIPGCVHVAYGDLDAMKAVIDDTTACVLIETIQAEGGIHVAEDAYLKGLRALCDERGALLFFDEVQTGYGRTGRFMSREWSGVWPDACAMAKGIGGGFPLGAIAVTAKVADGLPPTSHGSTFGGNALASAAGLAVLEVFDEEKLVDNAERVGAHLRAGLHALQEKHAVVSGVRGKGLLMGLRIAAGTDASKVNVAIREKGVILSVVGGDVIRFTPALNIKTSEIDEGLAIIDSVLQGFPSP